MTTTSVVGFEGSLDGSYDATWGTAAVQVGNELVNPTTRFRAAISTLDDLAEGGAIHRFSKPIPISQANAEDPLVIIAIREESIFRSVLELDTGRHGGVIKKISRDGAVCLVARNDEAVRQYSKDVAYSILEQVMKLEKPGRSQIPLIQAGLSLDPAHPYLNALRAYLAANSSKRIQALARACTRGARGKAAFDEFFRALSSTKRTHMLEYRKGITEGGGLDIEDAAPIFDGIVKLIKKLARDIREDWAFVPQVSSPRLHAMQPGSAKLVFKVDLGARPIGERVARYLELRALERALQGELPSTLKNDAAVDEALEAVVQPTQETRLWQKPLEGEAVEAVSISPPADKEDVVKEEFKLVCLVTGFFSDTEKLEVRIHPSMGGRLQLSTANNGDGKRPQGVDKLPDDHVDLFRLAVVALRRDRDRHGGETYWLRSLSLLEPNMPVPIKAVPSSVVKGEFCKVRGMTVKLTHSSVQIGDEKITERFVAKKTASYQWLREYYQKCEEIELAATGREWSKSVRPGRASMTARVVIAVQSLGGKAPAAQVAEEISRRFNTIQRINNTRREVLKNPRYLRFADESNKDIELLELGMRYAKAYGQAGGDVGVPLDGED